MTNSSSQALATALWQAAHAKQGQYTVRTRHLDAQGQPRFINRLIREDSPYLLQHAHNPVDWFAWNAEAFQMAAESDKPIFLSIGYSTCHWCHVMEEESFDNVEIAELLNRHFVCIKLDREQHPDIDDFYMTAVQFISGHGGWPMSSFLLPDGKPFFSATYFPPQQFVAVLNRVQEMWQSRRQELIDSAAQVSASVSRWLNASREAAALDDEKLAGIARQMLDREDSRWGGLAGAPKFPQEPLLLFFLREAAAGRDLESAGFALRSLEAMARGGIYDQVGGGFHRYSTDAQWLVPHFEKMLYNQSQLALACTQAWLLGHDPFLRRVAEQTLDYVLREMQLPEGGFYSATDADSEGEEGRYFVWTLAELRELLSPGELDLLRRYYDPTEAGNFESANILNLQQPLFATDGAMTAPDLINQLDAILLKLRQRREQRIPPLRDDKLIVAWSCNMATSLLYAARCFAREDYRAAARRAIDTVWKNCYSDATGLRRIYLNGQSSVAAQLEDHAALVLACTRLFDQNGDTELLRRAHKLQQQIWQLFGDADSGGLYNNRLLEQGPALARSSQASDGATLAAIAMALEAEIGLWRRRACLGEFSDQYSRDRIDRCIAAHAVPVTESPPSHVSFLRVLRDYRHGSSDLIQYAADGNVRVCVTNSDASIPDDRTRTISVQLSIADGWHLRATPTAQVPAALSIQLADNETAWELSATKVLQATPASGEYRGELTIELSLRQLPVSDLLAASVGIAVSLQACHDTLCLAQERLQFRL